MALLQSIARLGGWESYRLVGIEQERRGDQAWCVIHLKPLHRRRRRCGGCGRMVSAIHDMTQRRIRDLPIFETRVELAVPRLRLACPKCGPKLEQLSWLPPYARVTQRLADAVARLCSGTSVRYAADFFGLDWKTVKAIDCAALERKLGPIDLSGVQIIGMDEFAIQKGHRYATVIVEPMRKKVLWVGRGRGREDVRPFFELLGAQGCARIRAVAMDMNGAFEQEVRERCPQAQIVYDLFHVVAKYAREVVDRVRVDQANVLRKNKTGHLIDRGSRWLLLRNPQSMPPQARVALKQLLQANRPLAVVYLMRDELKALWHYRYVACAQRLWQQWYHRAIHSRIEPLKRFARRLKPYLAGILAHCQYPLGTNLIEGMNNKIKVIKRIAYGYRDDHYFFLKIRAAFPGNG